jgi:hypothetical protein
MIHLGLQFSWISLFRAQVLGQERRMAMRSSTLAFEELQEHRIVLFYPVTSRASNYVVLTAGREADCSKF